MRPNRKIKHSQHWTTHQVKSNHYAYCEGCDRYVRLLYNQTNFPTCECGLTYTLIRSLLRGYFLQKTVDDILLFLKDFGERHFLFRALRTGRTLRKESMFPFEFKYPHLCNYLRRRQKCLRTSFGR